VPAAAVNPAPIAYIKVVAVKKLVVGSRLQGWVLVTSLPALEPQNHSVEHQVGVLQIGSITLNKLECSKQTFMSV
jgi:hypothetical protein